LRGCFVTGLRLSEAHKARWDSDADVYPLIADARFPVWVFTAAQKNRREEHSPITPEGAEFLLSTPVEQREGLIFELEGRSGRLTVTVEDNGVGLPVDRQNEMLKRGVRLDETSPGSGLGLAIVDQIVRSHEGRVSVRNAPDGGAIFTIEFPPFQ
jgi:signal transduction histidine kinase